VLSYFVSLRLQFEVLSLVSFPMLKLSFRACLEHRDFMTSTGYRLTRPNIVFGI
jgi:hypothetical protein